MRAHRTDLVSLAFGLVFVALAGAWLLAQVLGLALPPAGWFLAGGLILIGVLGLTGALRSGRPDRNAGTRADGDAGAQGDRSAGAQGDRSAGTQGDRDAGTRPAAERTGAVDLGAGPGTGAGPAPADEWATTDPALATPTIDPTAASTPEGPPSGSGRSGG